ncbi:MAG: hypothetical protein M3R02_24105 [Chloroflexota bacterium]|nr:hypothetical protein [Chloroflexota bacterium]
MKVEGLLQAWASDDDGTRLGEYSFSFTATPGPDGWTLAVAGIMDPDAPVFLPLADETVDVARAVAGRFYGQEVRR